MGYSLHHSKRFDEASSHRKDDLETKTWKPGSSKYFIKSLELELLSANIYSVQHYAFINRFTLHRIDYPNSGHVKNSDVLFFYKKNRGEQSIQKTFCQRITLVFKSAFNTEDILSTGLSFLVGGLCSGLHLACVGLNIWVVSSRLSFHPKRFDECTESKRQEDLFKTTNIHSFHSECVFTQC